MFDKKDCGKIKEDELKKILTNKRGEPLDEEEIKAMYKGKPPIENGEVCDRFSLSRYSEMGRGFCLR